MICSFLHVKQENFERENFCKLVKNTIFVEKLSRIARLCHAIGRQFSQRKLSQIATKLPSSQKFSPSNVSCYTVLHLCFVHILSNMLITLTPPSPLPPSPALPHLSLPHLSLPHLSLPYLSLPHLLLTSPNRWWSIVKLVLQLLRRETGMVS